MRTHPHRHDPHEYYAGYEIVFDGFERHEEDFFAAGDKLAELAELAADCFEDLDRAA
jgi:hypothetical protein